MKLNTIEISKSCGNDTNDKSEEIQLSLSLAVKIEIIYSMTLHLRALFVTILKLKSIYEKKSV